MLSAGGANYGRVIQKASDGLTHSHGEFLVSITVMIVKPSLLEHQPQMFNGIEVWQIRRQEFQFDMLIKRTVLEVGQNPSYSD